MRAQERRVYCSRSYLRTLGDMVTTELDARPLSTPPRTGFLRELGGAPALGYIGPNWYAAVMGTGIVANATATLQITLPALVATAQAIWVLDLVLLLLISAATLGHWVAHPVTARGHLNHPVMSHFYGAPAMALMTVGAGALLVGQPVIGETAALWLAVVLWSAGTGLGLWTAVAVPLRAIRRAADSGPTGRDAAFGGWLMPVVPPMVSAATGPLFVPYLPAGQARLNLLLACLMMFGLTLVASLFMINLIWNRLVHHGLGPAAMVPTLWIVLGPLGQSITASHTIGVAADGILPAPYGAAVETMGVVYGVPMWGFAMLWVALAASATVRTARSGLPFSLTWWSFTFPVGTVVTGTSGLAAATGSHALAVVAVVLFGCLVGAWLTVAVRTARGVYAGTLLRAPVAG